MKATAGRARVDSARADRAAAGPRDRDLAADHDLRRLSRNRGHRGLGEHARDAVALEGLHGERGSTAGEVLERQGAGSVQRAVHGERIAIGEHAPIAIEQHIRICAGRYAELLEDGARHLGDGDLQHRLILAADLHSVDHAAGTVFVSLRREALGDVHRALRVPR